MLLDQQTNPFTFTVSRQRRKHLVDVVLVVAVVILILHSTPLPSSAPPANLPKPKPIGKSPQKMRSMERERYNITSISIDLIFCVIGQKMRPTKFFVKIRSTAWRIPPAPTLAASTISWLLGSSWRAGRRLRPPELISLQNLWKIHPHANLGFPGSRGRIHPQKH